MGDSLAAGAGALAVPSAAPALPSEQSEPPGNGAAPGEEPRPGREARVRHPGRGERSSSPSPSPQLDGGHAPIGEPADAIKGTIVVPENVVTRAIEKRDVGATNAKRSDGAPLGARLHGVSRYHAGLRDGDVVVLVAGTRIETTNQMVDAAMKALAAGATRLTGRIVRGDETWAVVLELPPRASLESAP